MYNSYVAGVTPVHGSGTSKTITWHLYNITLFVLGQFHFVFQLPPCLMQNKSCLRICFPLFAVSMAQNVFKIKFTTVHYFCSFTSFSAFS